MTRGGRPLVHHGERFGPNVAGSGSSVSVGAARHVVVMAVAVGQPAGPPRSVLAATGAAARHRIADDVIVLTAMGRSRPEAMEIASRVAPDLTAAIVDR